MSRKKYLPPCGRKHPGGEEERRDFFLSGAASGLPSLLSRKEGCSFSGHRKSTKTPSYLPDHPLEFIPPFLSEGCPCCLVQNIPIENFPVWPLLGPPFFIDEDLATIFPLRSASFLSFLLTKSSYSKNFFPICDLRCRGGNP